LRLFAAGAVAVYAVARGRACSASAADTVVGRSRWMGADANCDEGDGRVVGFAAPHLNQDAIAYGQVRRVGRAVSPDLRVRGERDGELPAGERASVPVAADYVQLERVGSDGGNRALEDVRGVGPAEVVGYPAVG